jgi:anti-sigma-K factor RskA
MLKAGKSPVRFPMRSLDISIDLINPSSRTMTLGLTQVLTEMSIRDLPGGRGRPARKADNLTAICESICLENVGGSTSHNPMGLHGLLQG